MSYTNLELSKKHEFYNLLCDIITPERRNLIESVVVQRTTRIVPVIENIHKSQNASAILRTCDCLGIQNIKIIENNNKFTVTDDISLGSNKWLNIQKYKDGKNNTEKCFSDLKQQGYKIVATTPHDNNISPDGIDINEKIAVVFGSEVDGISNDAIKNADMFMTIPMYGFTESFNISVSAAIILHHLTNKLRKSGINWQLNETEKLNTLIYWALQSIKNSDKIEKELLRQINP